MSEVGLRHGAEVVGMVRSASKYKKPRDGLATRMRNLNQAFHGVESHARNPGASHSHEPRSRLRRGFTAVWGCIDQVEYRTWARIAAIKGVGPSASSVPGGRKQ